MRAEDTVMVVFNRIDLENTLTQILMAEAGQPPVNVHLAFGLCEVLGTDNSAVPGQSFFGLADQLFPQPAFDPAIPPAVDAVGNLFIPNVTPDNGLSAPFNTWFMLFGQFFDHGLDLVSKGGSGFVFIPLAADDPLRVVGPDGVAGTGDEVSPDKAFMVLTRASNQPGA